MQSKDHWERIYAAKAATEVSWFQEHAELSLKLIRVAGVPPTASIIDVGGGASTLADDLLDSGYGSITVLDLSGTALAAAKARLGSRAAGVQWLEADVLSAALPVRAYDVWHDLGPGHRGHLCRRWPDQVQRTSGDALQPERTACGVRGTVHSAGACEGGSRTPSGKVQQFVYCFCRKVDS
jgi:hypothetical protein